MKSKTTTWSALTGSIWSLKTVWTSGSDSSAAMSSKFAVKDLEHGEQSRLLSGRVAEVVLQGRTKDCFLQPAASVLVGVFVCVVGS